VFSRRIHLFTLLGFRVGLDLSWFLIAILIVWSLSSRYFPEAVPGLDAVSYLILGLAGAIGLFASIIFHEFAHAMVARRLDMPIGGITLFLFGGVAELNDEPPSPRVEFLVAIVGPIASFFLAAAFYVLALGIPDAAYLVPVTAVLAYLALINLVLAVFNLLPAFPLDGGRVMRSAVWWWTNDLRRATKASALLGRVLGALLVGLGVISIISGDFIGGMWLALIGFFIAGAAGASEMQTELRLGLQDVRVARLMTRDPKTVPADITIQTLVDDYFCQHFHKTFPVVRDGRLIGCVNLTDINQIKRKEWSHRHVHEIVNTDETVRTVSPEAPVFDAMQTMQRGGYSQLMVVDGGQIVGMLTARDVMDFLAVRMELGSTSETTSVAKTNRPAGIPRTVEGRKMGV